MSTGSAPMPDAAFFIRGTGRCVGGTTSTSAEQVVTVGTRWTYLVSLSTRNHDCIVSGCRERQIHDKIHRDGEPPRVGDFQGLQQTVRTLG